MIEKDYLEPTSGQNLKYHVLDRCIVNPDHILVLTNSSTSTDFEGQTTKLYVRVILPDISQLGETLTDAERHIATGELKRYGIDEPIINSVYDLDAEKVKKLQQLSNAYKTANTASFTYNDKEYSANQTALNNLNGINGYVALNDALPASFPNMWQAIDGSIISVMDVATFKSLYEAMVNQGNANYIKLAMLEAYVSYATTQEQLELIAW